MMNRISMHSLLSARLRPRLATADQRGDLALVCRLLILAVTFSLPLF
jgi:hypothetical protein